MLRLVSVKKVGVSYPLLVDSKYTVGRKQGEITFPDDQSVSRIHAEIIVEHPAGNINEPLLTPVLTIEDVGSKFGTFATEDNINSKTGVNARERVTLSVGDKLRFGLQWNEYKVDYTPLVVSSSSFKPTADFKAKIVRLGGHFVSEWNGFVTHVVMESLTLTVKAVCALLAAKPIVTPAYFMDLLSAFETRKPPPDPKDFLPPVKEKGMANLSPSCFHANTARTTLFAGKTFLFCTPKHLKKVVAAIEAGGGIAKLVTDIIGENVLKSEFIIMGHPLDVADGEKDARLKAVIDAYRQGGKRLIADSEVGLAAVYNSIEKHCNPKYQMSTAVLPHLTTQTQGTSSVSIVPETQELETTGESGNGDTSINIVNETIVKPCNGGQTNEERVEKSQAQTTRGEKRGGVESESSSSKKRSAEESLSSPGAKRLKEISTSFSRYTKPSSQKSDSTRVLNSLFGFSDDEDDDNAVVPESQPEATSRDDMDAEVEVVPESQQNPLVSVVDVRNLQSMESTQESATTRDRPADETFRVPESPPFRSEDNNGGGIVPESPPFRTEDNNGGGFGTDFIETVTTTVMNAKTLPIATSKSHETTLNESALNKNAKRGQTNNQTGEDPGNEAGPSRKRRREENENDAAILAEKTKKINLEDQVVKKEEGTPGTSPLPFIKKPLMNKNHSRDVSFLCGANDSNADMGLKNFKSFRKVPPTFVNVSNCQENKSKWIETTNDLNVKPFKMTTYDYHPGEKNYKYGVIPPPLDPTPGRDMDDDIPEGFLRFDDTTPQLDNILQREKKKRAEIEEQKRQKDKANGTATKTAEQPSTSAGRRTSPRKKGPVVKLPAPQPPPVAPVIPDEEEEEQDDDEWTFNR